MWEKSTKEGKSPCGVYVYIKEVNKVIQPKYL
jgi:hypothetical protein